MKSLLMFVFMFGALPSPGHWETYQQAEKLWQVDYPAHWQPTETQMMGAILFQEVPEVGMPPRSFNVLTEDLNAKGVGAISLQDYTALNIRSLKNAFGQEEITQGVGKLDGRQAETLRYTMTFGTRKVYQYQLFVLRNGRAYVITFSSQNPHGEAWPPAEKSRILNSFEILG